MMPAQARNKMCPFLAQALATTAAAALHVVSAHPNSAGMLSGLVDKDDKNCRANNCMMWDSKRRDCGMKNS